MASVLGAGERGRAPFVGDVELPQVLSEIMAVRR
jgi:hypothetical protein